MSVATPNARHTFVAVLAIVLLLFAVPANAHVGSPNVFYEGDAGPYHLFVTVNVPAVIPGVADVQIRADSDDVRQVTTAVTRLAGAGSQYAPVPDVAQRSPYDPHLFTSSLWLMEYGSMRVLINVAGAHGAAQMSVPVPSAARRMLPMPRALGARAMSALEGIRDRLGLDYAGIDFGLDAQGNVLFFEANASMTIHPPAADERWMFRREPVARILDAARNLFVERAGTRATRTPG